MRRKGINSGANGSNSANSANNGNSVNLVATQGLALGFHNNAISPLWAKKALPVEVTALTVLIMATVLPGLTVLTYW